MKHLLLLTALAITFSSCGQMSTAQPSKTSSDEKITSMDSLEVATFGAGCFWCVEAIFQDIKGVKKVASGYSGGNIKNPSYKEVCQGTTCLLPFDHSFFGLTQEIHLPRVEITNQSLDSRFDSFS